MPRFACALVGVLMAFSAFAAEKPVEFNRDVRPILSENCFACHGPDARKVKAKFRFDVEKSAKGKIFVRGDSHRAGDAKKSEMLVARTDQAADAAGPSRPDESFRCGRLRHEEAIRRSRDHDGPGATEK